MRRDSKWVTMLGFCLVMVWGLGLAACGEDDDSGSSSNGATSNGTTATSNGTTATSNGTTATSNGTTATSNGTTATSNGTTATSNGTTATSNGTTATSNGTGDTIDCGGTMCGSDAVVVGGAPLLEFPPCCINNTDCGLDVTAAEDALGVSGCYELARAGDADESCAPVSIEVLGMMVELPGCCQEANGMCGVSLDVTALGAALGATGPDFGCQDPAPVDENYVPQACGQ